uniref:Uncharacterized protein n=1 Tax=Arundo donax TaxID=35708 RepID=A0A0A9B2F4_ARUDO
MIKIVVVAFVKEDIPNVIYWEASGRNPTNELNTVWHYCIRI